MRCGAMKPTLVHSKQLEQLDDLVEVLSTSRSALIRQAIDDMLERSSGTRSEGDAYERIPLDTPDGGGNLADWLASAREARSE